MTRIQQKPIIHGRDHMPGGADPIPGTTGGFTTYKELILSGGPWAYWPLDDAGGDFHEEIAGRDMTPHEYSGTSPGPYLFGYGEPGPFTDDAGTSVEFTGKDWLVIEGTGTRATVSLTDEEGVDVFGTGSTVEMWFQPVDPVVPNALGAVNYEATLIMLGTALTSAWSLYLDADGSLFYKRGSTTLSAGTASLGGWNYVAVTDDGTTVRLYLNGGMVASGASSTATTGALQLGRQLQGSPTMPHWFEGRIAHVALYDHELTAEEISKHMAGDLGPPPGGSGVELPPSPVGGGGGPGSGGGGWTGATDPGGYHYSAHQETAVLYSSVPGRFDVPSRTWTRAPFDTVGIFRRWQPTPGGIATEQFLPDDRGLTNAARNGILLFTAAMTYGTAEPNLFGYVAPEYPILDYTRLPNEPSGGSYDWYVRSIRFRNVTTGHVLREEGFEDGKWRIFDEWRFSDPASGKTVIMGYKEDNPYPRYPVWPARPLHKPLPYPTMGVNESLDYYKETDTGNGGWSNINGLEFDQEYAAGDKFVLEVWQDSPWLLRFFTNTYPHYTIDILPDYRNRPYLAVKYSYDPATIDHTTGVLL